MQGDSTTVLDNSAPDMATTATLSGGRGGGGGRSNSGEDTVIVDEADRMCSYGANRWPRQETLALLKIRSDMDSVFRDSSLKGPLWEEVSRKLAELGYHRSAKKCKEKFENVYKYHKRTKDGRTGKSEGKTYRFFDQLEAFESHHQSQTPPPPLPPPSTTTQHPPLTTTATLPWTTVTVPSTTNFTSHNSENNNNSNNVIEPAISPMPLSSSHPLNPPHHQVMHPTSFQNVTSHLFSSSTSSSTASDEELQGSRKRKRWWKEFFEQLTKDVIKKQEELQNKLLETVEKRDNERIALEEAWRLEELSRINREHEILIRERTTAAAKDAAVIAFLQKMSGQHNSNIQLPDIPPPAPAPAPAPVVEPVPAKMEIRSKENEQNDNNNGGVQSSSRWPKIEVEALIRLRTSLETKYQENGPKGPLWEDISAGMRRLGYNRSSKRCKEKWENINKYFKKVKESNKKRSGDSKTCPYFHQLDAMYREKAKNININSSVAAMEPLMVQPEQQWPPQQVVDHNAKEDEEEDDDDEDGGETEEEEGGGGSFQVVAGQPPALLGQ